MATPQKPKPTRPPAPPATPPPATRPPATKPKTPPFGGEGLPDPDIMQEITVHITTKDLDITVKGSALKVVAFFNKVFGTTGTQSVISRLQIVFGADVKMTHETKA
jgi:hypothetical protein